MVLSPAYPGYLFVEAPPETARDTHPHNHSTSKFSLLMTPQGPATVSPRLIQEMAEMEKIWYREAMGERDLEINPPKLSRGTRVVIESGWLKGKQASVDQTQDYVVKLLVDGFPHLISADRNMIRPIN